MHGSLVVQSREDGKGFEKSFAPLSSTAPKKNFSGLFLRHLFPLPLHKAGRESQVVFHSEACEDVMAEVDPTTVTTHVRAYWAKKKKVLDEIVLKDTLGALAADPSV